MPQGHLILGLFLFLFLGREGEGRKGERLSQQALLLLDTLLVMPQELSFLCGCNASVYPSWAYLGLEHFLQPISFTMIHLTEPPRS